MYFGYLLVSVNNGLSSQGRLTSGSKLSACISLTDPFNWILFNFFKKMPRFGWLWKLVLFLSKSHFLGFFLGFAFFISRKWMPMYRLDVWFRITSSFSFPTKLWSGHEFEFWHPGFNIHDEILHLSFFLYIFCIYIYIKRKAIYKHHRRGTMKFDKIARVWGVLRKNKDRGRTCHRQTAYVPVLGSGRRSSGTSKIKGREQASPF